MTDQAQQSPDQIAVIQAFNESVNAAALRNFELNQALLGEGISSTGVALANALSAADLTAAMAVEAGNGLDVVEVLLTKLLDDMKSRAAAAFEYYSQQKAESEAAPANNCVAVSPDQL